MIISYQVKEYSNIRTWTHRDLWITTDREFYALQLQETRLAAADIIDHYGTGTQQQVAASKSLRDAVQLDLWGKNGDGVGGIIGNLSDTATEELDEGIEIINSEYVSFPANLTNETPGTVYRSTNVFI
jgi:hypothetical protein